MNWRKIRTIIIKEWADTFRNKLVFFSLIFMPLLFVAMPVLNLYFMRNIPTEEVMGELGPFLGYQSYFELGDVDTLLIGMTSIYMVLFLILPLMLPMIMASDSIVSEKVTKSLEPLLATPISVTELLVGKALAAVTPAVLATWISYGLFVALSAIFLSPAVVGVLISWDWLVGIGLLSPLMGLLAVGVGVIVSSRVNDTRTAQQVGGFLVVPLMLIFIPMFLGTLVLTGTIFLIGAFLFAILDVAVLIAAVALFQRETILTRWK
jgi:ABC-2 type transport system permease protein